MAGNGQGTSFKNFLIDAIRQRTLRPEPIAGYEGYGAPDPNMLGSGGAAMAGNAIANRNALNQQAMQGMADGVPPEQAAQMLLMQKMRQGFGLQQPPQQPPGGVPGQ